MAVASDYLHPFTREAAFWARTLYKVKALSLFFSFQALLCFPISLPTLFQKVPYHVLSWGLLPGRWDPQPFVKLPSPILAVELLGSRDHSWSCCGFIFFLPLPSVSTSLSHLRIRLHLVLQFSNCAFHDGISDVDKIMVIQAIYYNKSKALCSLLKGKWQS